MEHHMIMEAGLDERRDRLLQESSEKWRAEGAHFSSASSSPATSPAAVSAVASPLSSAAEFAGAFVQRSKENKAGEMSATADASVRSRPPQISGPPQICPSCGCCTSASSMRCAGCAAPLGPPPPKAPEGKHADEEWSEKGDCSEKWSNRSGHWHQRLVVLWLSTLAWSLLEPVAAQVPPECGTPQSGTIGTGDVCKGFYVGSPSGFTTTCGDSHNRGGGCELSVSFAFERHDSNADGFIDVREGMAMLAAMGIAANERGLKYRTVDTNKDGKTTLAEWKTAEDQHLVIPKVAIRVTNSAGFDKKYEMDGADFGPRFIHELGTSWNFPLAVAPAPFDACSSLPAAMKDKIVLAKRGTCEFSKKAKLAQDAGAKAVIIVNSDETLIPMLTGTFGSQISIPCVMIHFSAGEELIAAANTGLNVAFPTCLVGGSVMPGYGMETCDDGNTISGDGCDKHCMNECGNTLMSGQETCDDGNVLPKSDGCSETCKLYDGFYSCSVLGCATKCGDRVTVGFDAPGSFARSPPLAPGLESPWGLPGCELSVALAFPRHDKDGDGFLSVEESKGIFKAVGTTEFVSNKFAERDLNKDNKLSLQEWKEYFKTNTRVNDETIIGLQVVLFSGVHEFYAIGTADFGPDPRLTLDQVWSGVIMAAKPHMSACEALDSTQGYKDTIIIARRGTCEMCVKAEMAQNVGAKALIIENSDDTIIPMLPGSCGHLVKIPTIMVTKSVGEKFLGVDGASILDQYLAATVIFPQCSTGGPIKPGYGLEECDDGNTVSGDGCSAQCLCEGTCKQCQAGKYKAMAGTAVCDDCAEGKYSAAVGASGPSTCVACPANSLSPAGSTAVANCICSAGSSGDAAAGTCPKCVAGKFKEAPGTATCSDCGAGKYSTSVGASADAACIQCPADSASPAGSTAVAACTCNIGSSGPDGGPCTACVAGKYKPAAGNNECTDCGAGKYGIATGQSAEASCTACGTGKHRAETGGSAEASCTSCTPNSISPSQSTAQAACLCATGFGGDASTGACAACVAGKYKPAAGNNECTDCGAGKYGDATGQSAEASCTTCGAGKYRAETGGSGEASCTSCAPNSISPSQSSARAACLCATGFGGDASTGACAACVAGKYKPAAGNSDCTDCGAGKYGDATGQSAEASCTACGAGKYGEAAGPTAEASCTACGAGKYRAETGGSSEASCTSCAPNSISPSQSTAQAACICDAGYSGTAGTGACAACVAGKYKFAAGGGDCTDCGSGKYGDATGQSAEASCTACGEGKYGAEAGGSAEASCTTCGAGKYRAETGGSSEASCTSCTPNSISPSQSTAQAACLCATGYAGDASTGACAACVAGKYKSSGNGECADCGAGKYGDATGQSAEASCTACGTGKHRAETGGSGEASCTACTSNSISPSQSTAQAACLCATGFGGDASTGACAACVAGKYKPAAGNSDCTDCGAGKYGDATGQSAEASCTACGAGKYGEAAGPTAEASCTACGAGKYRAETGGSSEASCTSCAPNSISPSQSTAQAACICDAGYFSSDGAPCKACPPNSISPVGSSSQRACTCRAGWSGKEQWLCEQCVAGKYKVGLGHGDNFPCQDCGKDTYSVAVGGTSDSVCSACPTSSASPAGSSDVAKCICSVGSSGSDGGPCPLCVAGKFKTAVGSAACSNCDAGKYSEKVGSSDPTTCSACPALSNSPAGSTAVAACTCNAGSSGSDGGPCTTCVAGKYKNAQGPAACSDCGSGKYSAKMGSTSDADCSDCGAGKFSDAAGAAECKLCVAGKYKAAAGAAQCINCEANYYSDTLGAAACSACPVNTKARVGASVITNCSCNAGSAGPLGGPCDLCAAGTFSARGLECTPCPANSNSPPASQILRHCTCNPGSSGPDGGPCSQCVAGKYKAMPGSAACINCAANKYLSEAGGSAESACSGCPPNSKSPVASPSIAACSCTAGSTGPAGGPCNFCAAGTFSAEGWVTGYAYAEGGWDWGWVWGYRECLECPKHSDSPMGSQILKACTCNIGSTGPDGGPCTLCVAGKYKVSSGTARCSDCVTGKYSAALGASAHSNCTACPTDSNSPGASPALTSCICNTGSSGANGGPCVPCVSGKYKVVPGTAACSDCAWGKYSGAVGSTTASFCSACPLNSISTQGSTTLTDCICNAGSSGPAGGICTLCSPGKYRTGEETDCSDCERGKFSASVGAFASFFCLACPSNADAPAGSPSCTCNTGSSGLDGDACVPCVAGKYKDVTGSTTCSDCGAGKYSVGVGATSESTCLACPMNLGSLKGSYVCSCNAGWFGPDGGSCNPCEAGKYKSFLGSSCSDCPAGKYSAEDGAKNDFTCKACANNSYSPAGSSALKACSCNAGWSGPSGGTCTSCMKGKFKAVGGIAPCSNCGAGKFSASAGASICSACPMNSDSPAGSANITDCSCMQTIGWFGPDGGICNPVSDFHQSIVSALTAENIIARLRSSGLGAVTLVQKAKYAKNAIIGDSIMVWLILGFANTNMSAFDGPKKLILKETIGEITGVDQSNVTVFSVAPWSIETRRQAVQGMSVNIYIAPYPKPISIQPLDLLPVTIAVAVVLTLSIFAIIFLVVYIKYRKRDPRPPTPSLPPFKSDFPSSGAAPIYGPAHVILKLFLDYGETGEKDSIRRRVFKDMLVQDLASASSLPPKTFEITDILPGSTMVHLDIHAFNNSDMKTKNRGHIISASQVLEDLQMQMTQSDSRLRKGRLTCHLVSIEVCLKGEDGVNYESKQRHLVSAVTSSSEEQFKLGPVLEIQTGDVSSDKDHTKDMNQYAKEKAAVCASQTQDRTEAQQLTEEMRKILLDASVSEVRSITKTEHEFNRCGIDRNLGEDLITEDVLKDVCEDLMTQLVEEMVVVKSIEAMEEETAAKWKLPTPSLEEEKQLAEALEKLMEQALQDTGRKLLEALVDEMVAQEAMKAIEEDGPRSDQMQVVEVWEQISEKVVKDTGHDIVKVLVNEITLAEVIQTLIEEKEFKELEMEASCKCAQATHKHNSVMTNERSDDRCCNGDRDKDRNGDTDGNLFSSADLFADNETSAVNTSSEQQVSANGAVREANEIALASVLRAKAAAKAAASLPSRRKGNSAADIAAANAPLPPPKTYAWMKSNQKGSSNQIAFSQRTAGDKNQPHSEQQPQPKNPATPPFESPREEALIISGSPQPLNCSVKPQQTMISAIRLTPPDSLQQPQKTKISPPQSTHMSISQPQNETQVQQTTSQRQTAVLPAPSIGTDTIIKGLEPQRDVPSALLRNVVTWRSAIDINYLDNTKPYQPNPSTNPSSPQTRDIPHADTESRAHQSKSPKYPRSPQSTRSDEGQRKLEKAKESRTSTPHTSSSSLPPPSLTPPSLSRKSKSPKYPRSPQPRRSDEGQWKVEKTKENRTSPHSITGPWSMAGRSDSSSAPTVPLETSPNQDRNKEGTAEVGKHSKVDTSSEETPSTDESPIREKGQLWPVELLPKTITRTSPTLEDLVITESVDT